MAKFIIEVPIEQADKPEYALIIAVQKLSFEMNHWHKQMPIRIMEGKKEQCRITYKK